MGQFAKRPSITTIEEAEKWIGIHHHWAIQDAGQISRLLDRVWWLEQSWWFRLTHPGMNPRRR